MYFAIKITAADTAAMVSGDSIIPSAADDGKGSRVAAGTAVTYTKVGTATGPIINTNFVLADLNIPETT